MIFYHKLLLYGILKLDLDIDDIGQCSYITCLKVLTVSSVCTGKYELHPNGTCLFCILYSSRQIWHDIYFYNATI